MNLTLQTDLFAQALRRVAAVAPKKAVIPILANVLLQAESTTLRLSTTDLEVSLTTSCDASVTQHGSMTLPVARLAEIVSKLTSESVTLSMQASDNALSALQANIVSGAFTSRLQTLPAEDFPTLPRPIGDAILLNGDAFRTCIRKVKTCVSDDHSRYTLNCALFVLTHTTMTLVATDGRRLAMATALHTGLSLPDTMLPLHTLDLLLQTDGDLSFSISEQQLFFTSEHAVITSRTLEGQFPAYQRIIPTNPSTAILHRQSLIAALERVALMASRESSAVTWNLTPNQVQLSTVSAEIGDAVEILPITYAGDTLTLSLNGSFVLDMLNNADTETVTLAVKDAISATLFSDGANFITVIMPMRM